MNRSIFAAAYALDWLIGDPEWLPHPVRLIGWLVRSSERALRRLGSGQRYELLAGGLMAAGVPCAAYLATRTILRAVRSHRALSVAAEICLASTCLATRNLLDEAAEVLRRLDAGDLNRARVRLARIVGRDTENLDETEICRAVIETLAESLCDGIVAPIFYLALGGAPLAMSYKAVNTLDSMIGHKDERYFYFGRAAARLDDAANYLPARMSALLLCAAASLISPQNARLAITTWLSDGRKHASPNAGQSESAMAGALQVRLGGTNTYSDEVVISPHLGESFDRPSLRPAHKAVRLTAVASLIAFAAASLFVTIRNR